MSAPRWTKVSTRELRRLHRDGATVRVLAARFGLAPSTIHRRLTRSGQVRPKNVVGRFDEATKDRAATIYRSGLGLAFVARFLRLRNKNAAARVLRACGVEIRSGP